jgi:hypothetical protein
LSGTENVGKSRGGKWIKGSVWSRRIGTMFRNRREDKGRWWEKSMVD